jgi:cytochrome c-type biogenesis protein
MSAPAVGYLAAYGAGLVSFLSPCVLPLVPVYLSVISGVGVADLGTAWARRRVGLSALGFVLGFSIVFVTLGATASSAGALLAQWRDGLAAAAGVLAIAMGLVLIGLIRWPGLARERRFHPSVAKLGVLAAPVLGAGFAFGWTPCIGPVLASILGFAATRATVGQGMALLAAYSAGLGTPMLLMALAFDRLAGTWVFFKRRAAVVNAVAGGLLVLVGILLVTGQMRLLTSFVSRLVPAAGKLG